MHLRVFLNLVGQLIAIPAALFLMPTTCPRPFSTTTTTTTDDSPATTTAGAGVDESGIMIPRTAAVGLDPASSSNAMTTGEEQR